MAHTYDELRHKTVAQLREIASGIDHEQLQGHSTMHKDGLLHALCAALGLEEHVHHDVVGIDKRGLKAQIKALKVQRDAALESKDRTELKRVRRQMHRLRRKIRAATV